jgi:hypothetical protein
LDVDLVWHTHQLAPRAYYKSTTTHSGKLALRKPKFVDHNDKVEESTLARSFERTSATYLAKFGEVYSECACGFCEGMKTVSLANESETKGKRLNLYSYPSQEQLSKRAQSV